MSVNKVILIGNVGADPDVRYLENSNTQGNAKVASFRLAISERFKDRNGETRENTEWVNVAAWNKTADVVEKFVKKGTQLYVEGKIKTRKWTDKDGNERYTTEIQADSVQLLGKRPDAQENAPAVASRPAPEPTTAAEPVQEDLPF